MIFIDTSAWIAIEDKRDKTWSFTDCTSKVIMKRLGIFESFAFDRHFDQMGFLRKPLG